jgi:hypothetical protein
VLNVNVVRSVRAANPDDHDAGVDAARARRRRRATIGFGTAAALTVLLGTLYPSRWTLLGAVLSVVLFIGRRSLGRVVRLIAFAVIPYQVIWAGFVAARGLGDRVPWVDQVRLWPRQLEVLLFGGEMPTTVLQRHLFDPNHLRPYDYFFTGIHVSFFIVPFIAAMPLCWTDPVRGRRFLVALALLLTLGLPGFFLLPANPPWMNPAAGDPNPVPAYRVNAYVAGHLGVAGFAPDGTLKVEENSLAAVPSIHMGVSFLLVLSAPFGRRRWRFLVRLYAALMAFSLVYLGEHQVVDELLGIALAVLAWRLSATIAPWLEHRFSALPINAWAGRLSGALGARFPADGGGVATEGEPAR